MADHPIIFSGPMIRALLEGRKTMTRRLAWKLPRVGPEFPGKQSVWQHIKPGDLLWVKEGACLHYFGAQQPGYRADWTEASSEVAREPKWTPFIYMPRWASRLTLRVTATKIERLQEISEEDAIAEGIEPGPHINGHDPKTWRDYAMRKYDPFEWYSDPRRSFQSLWELINGPNAWVSNPEVIAISFEVLKSNIDAVKAGE